MVKLQPDFYEFGPHTAMKGLNIFWSDHMLSLTFSEVTTHNKVKATKAAQSLQVVAVALWKGQEVL